MCLSKVDHGTCAEFQATDLGRLDHVPRGFQFLEPEGTPDLLAGLKELEAWLGTRKGKGTWSRARAGEREKDRETE